jgi:hypothetical protein
VKASDGGRRKEFAKVLDERRGVVGVVARPNRRES